MPASTIKPKSSFQRLRQRVGLASDKDKNLPPPPPLVVDTAAAARASGETTKDDTIRAPASSAPRGPIPKLDVRHSSEVSQPSLSGGAVSDTTGGGNNANPLPSPRHSLSRPTPMPTSPTTATTPQPEQHTMLFKKSNPLMRMTSRLIPNSKRGIAATPPPPTAAEQRAPIKPILNLTVLHKASQREMEEAEEVARVRREEALRARGLRPARAAKPLSEMEAEECRKVGVVELHADGPSEAAALADTWRAQNANGSGTVDEHGFTGRPSCPTAVTPPRKSAENPPSPPSTRSRKSADGPVAAPPSPSRVPSSSSPAAVIQLQQAPDSTEKVAKWLRNSPARATVGSHDVNIEEEKTDLTAEATEDDGGPRPKSSPSPSSAEASVSAEPESTDQDHEDDSCEHDGDADPVESLASPVSPITRTLSDASHLAPPPLSPIIPSSSSEASHTTSIEPVTPSTTSGSLRTRGFSAARGGMAPIIVETAEENILRDERGILASPEATEFGKLPSVPESTPVTSSPTHLRPPGKGKGERRSLGFLFGKSPSRSATLAHPPMPPPPPMPAPKSMGDLRRGMTLSVPSRTKKPAAVHSPTSTSAPATPLAPTMHSHGSIVTGVQYIDDEESRRLSELAFVC